MYPSLVGGHLKKIHTWLLISVTLLTLAGCGAAAVALLASGGAGAATGTLATVAATSARPILPAAILPFTAELSWSTISPDGSKLYAIDRLHNSLNVYDLRQQKLARVIDIPGLRPAKESDDPLSRFQVPVMKISSDGKRLYITNPGQDQLLVFDAISLNLLRNMDTGGDAITGNDNPVALEISRDNKQVYIANSDSDSVSLIDTGSYALTRVNVGDLPAALAINPVSGRVYVANRNVASLSVIDPASGSVEDTIALANNPTALSITPDGETALVVLKDNTNTYQLAFIETESGASVDLLNLQGIPGGSIYEAVVTSPAGNLAFVSSSSSFPRCNDIAGGDTNYPRLIAIDLEFNDQQPLDVAPQTTALIINADGKRAFAAGMCPRQGSASTQITDLDLSTAGSVTLSEFAIPGQLETTGLALGPIPAQPNKQRLYAVHMNAVTAIDVEDTSAQTTIAARGPGPYRLAYNPQRGMLIASNAGARSVSMVDIHSGTDEAINLTIATGGNKFEPVALASATDNNGNSSAYVADTGSYQDTISKKVYKIDITPAVSQIPNGTYTVVKDNLLGPISVAVDPISGDTEIAEYGQFVHVDEFDDLSNFDQDRNKATKSIASADPFFFRARYENENQGGSIAYRDGNNTGNTIASADMPLPVDLAYNEDQKKLVVLDYLGSFEVLNPQQVQNNLANPQYGYSGGSLSVFDVTLDANNRIDNIALDNTLADLPAGGELSAAFVPDEGFTRAFVVNSGDRQAQCLDNINNPFPCPIGNTVTVVDLTANAAANEQITVGQRPLAIAKLSLNGQEKAYVPAYLSNNVTVIDMGSRQVLKTIAVGQGPVDVVTDDANDKVYIANSRDGTVTVIDALSDSVERTINLNL